MGRVISLQKRLFINLVGPRFSGKRYLMSELMKVATFQIKISKNYFFHQHPQLFYDKRQDQNEKFEFVQGVNFELINYLKNNGTKYQFVFDDSCPEIGNTKVFLGTATAGSHRGFNTIYNKHNLFHHSRLTHTQCSFEVTSSCASSRYIE